MRCIGITKSKKICNNKCKFLFCHDHRFQPFKVGLWLIGTIVTLYGLYQIFWGQKNTSQEDITSLEKRFEQFAIPDFNSNTIDPGFGILLTLEFVPQSEKRRKYITDVAQQRDKNRISLYLDPNNILTFELIDSVGSIYNTKIPSSEYEFNKLMVLYCEYGISSDFSYFRIFINKSCVAQNKYIFKVRLPRDIKVASVLGADLDGKNNMRMAVKSYIIRVATLGKVGRDELFDYERRKYNVQY